MTEGNEGMKEIKERRKGWLKDKETKEIISCCIPRECSAGLKQRPQILYLFYLVGWDFEYCGHLLAYCTSPG
jgi:hypothetical protein